jgi:hypothetical protein
MFLFSRTARLEAGSTREAMAWAIAVTEKVNQIVELDVELWTTVFSPGLGTLAWSTMAADLAQLEAADAKLAADDGLLDLQDSGARFLAAQPTDDLVSQIVHPAELPDAAGAPKPQYASVVRAVVAPGHFAAGVLTGIEIATRATAVTGNQTLFLTESTGSYGGVAWITGSADVQALQAENAAIEGDPSFVEFLDREARDCYQPSVTSTIYKRVV